MSKEKIGGVRVTDVNVETLIKKLDELGCSYETNEQEDLLQTFQDWTKKNLSELKANLKQGESIEYGSCEKCHAQCPVDWEQCPVCGTSYDDDGEEPEQDKVYQALLVREQDLDDAVARIKRHKTEAENGIYNLGLELQAVFDNQLYKVRKNPETGKQLYTSWDAFTEKEIGISAPRARTFMQLAREFTEEQVVQIGPEKLRSIARLDRGEVREKMLEKAKTMSTREVAKAVASSKNVKGPEAIVNSLGEKEEKKNKQQLGLALGHEAAKEARERKKAAKNGNGVTAVFQDGTYEIPLTEMEDEDGLEGYETLVNGTVRYYRIYRSEMKLSITTSRTLEEAKMVKEALDNDREEESE